MARSSSSGYKMVGRKAPPFPSAIWQSLRLAARTCCVELFLVVRKVVERNVELMWVHFENVIGVRRIVAVTGTDGGNEEAIIGLSEGLERSTVVVPLGKMC
jgi:hypothetical protein